MNLTINYSSSSVEEVTVCDTYFWNGEVYTESGEYTYNTTTIDGCDSVATLNLTINYSSSSETDITACDSYLWNGEIYTSSGTYTYNTTTAAGCDSLATLNLTINYSSSSGEEVTSCDSYEWNGELYTESGVYNINFINSSGCDSIASLSLTINNSSSSEQEVVACDSYEWNGDVYTESGEYIYNTTNTAGCDSVATLYLTINNASPFELSVSDISTNSSFVSWNTDDFLTYDIEYFISDDSSTIVEVLNYEESDIELTDLLDGVEYTFNIIAFDENNCTYSTEVAFTTLLSCNSPEELEFSFTPNTATISWDVIPTNANTFEVYYYIPFDGWNYTIVEGSSLVVNYLTGGTLQLYIKSVCEDYSSSWSELFTEQLPTCDIELTANVTPASCLDSLGSVSFEVENAYGNYTINTNDLDVSSLTVGTYTFSVTDDAGCTDSEQVSIGLQESNLLSVAASSTQLCVGEEATLTATDGFTSYQWYDSQDNLVANSGYTFTTSNSDEYYAIAIDENGCISTSNLIEINIITVQAVTDLEFSNITSNYATLDWDNASQTDVYNIEYSADGGETWTTIEGHQGSSISLSGLLSYTTYDVIITSVDYGCESELFTSSFTTLAECITPENISLVAGAYDVTLSWDPVLASTSYKVVYSMPSTGWVSTIVTDTFINLSHLGEGGFGYFYIRSICEDGIFSSYSDLYSIELPICDIDISVVSSSDVVCSGESVELNVTTDYSSYQWLLDGEQINEATFSTYMAFEGGEYAVTVSDSQGCTATSETYNLTEISSQSSSEIEISDVSSTTATLSWYTDLDLESYNISYSSDGGVTWTSIEDFEDTEITLTSLDPYTSYEVLVASSDYSCLTFSGSFTTLADCVPPSNISISSSAYEVTYSWQAVLGATSYKVIYYLPSSGWNTTTVTDTFITASHLGEGGFTYFYVRSNCDGDDISSYSNLYYIELSNCDIEVSMSTLSNSFCDGESIELNVSSDFSSYQWYLDDEQIDGATTSSITASESGDYSVVVSNSIGCIITSDVLGISETVVDAVSEVEFNNLSSSYVSVDWNNASQTDMYRFEYSSDGGVSWTIIDEHQGSSINLSDLSANTTYTIVITSLSYGCESDPFTTSFTTLPECITPENISVSTTVDNVTLSWDDLFAATSYTVVYYLPQTGWQTTSVTDNYITLTHLSEGGYAYFYVRSQCGEGINSPYSDLYSIELVNCDVDVIVSSLSSVYCIGDEYELSASSGFETYQWYLNDESIEDATSSTYSVSAGGSYYVVATSYQGCNITSEDYVVTEISGASSSDIEISDITATSVHIEWESLSSPEVYEISYSTDGGSSWTILIDEYEGTEATLTGLSVYTNYDLLITSTTYSCETYTGSFTTLADCVPPSNISLVADADEVTISWSHVFGATSYKLIYYLAETGWQTTTVTDTELTLNHLGEGGYAYFYIRSNCEEGIHSSYSNLNYIELPDCESHLWVTASDISFCTGNSVNLSVSSDFVTYQWYYNDEVIQGATTSTISVSQGGEYYVNVSDSIGCSVTSYSEEINEIVVDAVSSIEFNDLSSSYVSVDWDNASQTGMYDFEYSSDGGLTWTIIEDHQGSSINLFDLSSYTTYDIIVTSVAFECESEPFTSSFTTLHPCITPTNIELSATSSDVTISWDAVLAASSYQLVYYLVETGWQSVSVTDTYYTLSHGGNGGYGYFYLRSNCGENTFSPYSDFYSIELPDCDIDLSITSLFNSICIGDNLELSVPSNYSSYQWYLNDEPIEGAVTSNVLILTGGQYSVIVTTDLGCQITSEISTITEISSSTTYDISVDDISSSSAYLEWENISEVENYDISLSVDGGSTWSTMYEDFEGTEVSLTGLSSFTNYTILITSSTYNCESYSATFTTMADCVSPTDITLLADADEVTFSWGAVLGASSYKVVYYLPETGWQNTTVTDSFISLSHLGEGGFAYFYVRTNCEEGIHSPYSELYFIELTDCDIDVSITSASTAFCVGEDIELSVSSDFASYQWYVDNTLIDGATSSSYTASSGGQYHVVVSNDIGCQITSNSLNVTEISSSSLDIEVSNITTSAVDIEWNNVSDVEEYNISYSIDGGATWVVLTEDYVGTDATLTGLTPYTNYDILISSVAYSCETYTTSFTTLADCVPPSNITLSATGSEVTLSWDAVLGATSYSVIYYLPSTGWVATLVTDTDLTLSHSGEGGFAYFYVRTNCGDEFISSYSNLHYIELPDCDLDVSITALSTTFCVGESTELSVSSDYLSYQWYLDGEQINGATLSSYTATEGGEYSVVVTNALACFVTSEVLEISETVLEAVSSVEFDNLTSSYVSIDWDNPSPTGMYNFEYSSDGGVTWTTIEDHQGSSINLSDLSSYTTYDIIITSVSYGCESEPFTSSFSTLAECTTPTNVSLSATSTEVTLSWDPVFAASSYKVVYYLSSTGWVSATVTDTFITLTHLGEGGFAYFYVRSNCGEGISSSYSDFTSIELPDCEEELSITTLSTNFCSGQSVELSVSSDYTAYQWYLDDEEVDGATTNSYNASQGGEYFVVITNSFGCNITSESIEISETIIEAVSTVEFDNLTTSYVSIDWDNASQTGIYNFEYSSDGGVTWTTIEDHQGSSINLMDLSSSTTYDIVITSVSFGCESEAFSSQFTTLSECLSPTNISVSNTTTSATISWDEMANAQSYEILYDFGNGFVSESTESNSVTLDLSAASSYEFYLKTICSDEQESDWSELQSFTVSCDEPDNLEFSNEGTDVTIDWDGNATEYWLIYNYGNGWNYVYPTESEYSLSNVAIGSTIYVYIRSLCDSENNFVSSWASDSYTTVSGAKLAQSQSPTFELYPNPTNGEVSISFVNDNKSDYQLLIVDAFGKEVYNQYIGTEMLSTQFNVNLSNYSKGVYIVKIIGDQATFTRRLILQ